MYASLMRQAWWLSLVLLASLFVAISSFACEAGSAGDGARPPSVRLSGMILDQGRAAGAGVAVGLVISDQLAALLRDFPGLDLRACTDRRGRFELEVPTALGAVTLVARAGPLLSSSGTSIELKAAAIAVDPITLPRKHVLRARVIDEDRVPVEGATVVIRQIGNADTVLSNAERAVSAKSDSAGLLSFADVAEGSYSIEVTHGEEYVPRSITDFKVTPQPPVASIEMYRAVFIAGKVMNAARAPIPGATLVVKSQGRPPVETQSGDDGTFILGPFPRGTHLHLTTTAQGFAQARSGGIVAPLAGLEVLLRANGVLRGRVVDARDGRPVDRFEIAFARRPEVPSRTAPFPGSKSFSTVDGAFRWTDLESAIWSLTVTAPGYAPLDVHGVNIEAGKSTDELLFALRRGVKLTGRVTDKRSGQPISGASVTYEDRSLQVYEALLVPRRAAVTTDRHGGFALSGLPGSGVDLLVQVSGYAAYQQRVVPTDESFIEIALEKGVIVAGVLTRHDGVTPVIGMISLFEAVKGTGGSLRTDTSGRFQFRNVRPGSYQLSGSSDTGRSRQLLLNVDESHDITDLRLALNDGRAIYGTITGLLPGERQGVDIQVRGANGVAEQVVADSAGVYSVYALPPGSFTVGAITRLGRQITNKVTLSKDYDARVDFVFPDGNRVSGRVTRSGKPVPFVTVEAVPMDGQIVSGAGESSQSGQYTIEGLQAGSYTIYATGRRRSTSVRISGDAKLDISLPELSLAGRVTRADTTEPLPSAQVMLSGLDADSGRRFQERAISGNDGRFSVTNLDPGEYQLNAHKAGYELFTQSVRIDDSIAGHEIALAPASGVELSVTDAATGQGVRRVRIVESPDTGVGVAFEIVLEDGVGRLPQSLRGRSLLLSSLGYSPVSIARWDGAPLRVSMLPAPE